MPLHIHTFVFNDFGVNTYVLEADNRECIIVDAACHSANEEATLSGFISSKKLKPILHISTHPHIDHILGSAFIKREYNIPWLMHAEGTTLLKQSPMFASMFGLELSEINLPDRFISDNEKIDIGDSVCEILFTPGHAPGSVCLYFAAEKLVITGDVLFCGSIGRTDLPGGNTQTLLNSIAEKLLVLPNDTKVYPGHGPTSTIGSEKNENPYLM
ncbi:MAG: MBL fold hydrolase [Bacteroidetes bacterium HGW-Bacteroidetes-6]|jgi:glyoxylase-like metal-dependent hydrolase (beta-lactamase superfamily II)|nr:MAG: MBL fold hydrolase [Bacteroidetes bacterium HGW-Bacteroidetes-6]